MTLELRNISKINNGQLHIHVTNLTLNKGSMNVLLGPTQSGKTSLMRLMAGLDAPTTGQVFLGGRRRNRRTCARSNDSHGVSTIH